ncbi:MAG: hypothetical protein AAGA99_03495 [Actinomycetota bacterium]
MSHLVIFKSAEGKQAYHQSASLDEAVRFLEHLRNVERVEQAKLYKLTEVPVEFKAYFRAELPGAEAAAGESATPPVAPASVPPVPSPVAAPVPEAPVPADAEQATNGKRGLLKR